MLILMTDTFKHSGDYPRYTLAMPHPIGDVPVHPIVICQYGDKPTDIRVSVYETMDLAYETYKLFVGEEQPFIPALDRTA